MKGARRERNRGRREKRQRYMDEREVTGMNGGREGGRE